MITSFFKIALKTIKQNILYYALFILTVFCAFIINLTFDKNAIVILINSHHNSITDYTFKFFTTLGDKYMILSCIILLTFFYKQIGFELLCAFVTPVLMSYGLKHFIFKDAQRPFMIISNELLHLIEHHPENTSSFPSGHSTIIFAITTYLTIKIKNTFASVLFFLTGFVVCYSRLYLAQHFLIDVIAGAIIGIIFSSIALICLELEPIKKIPFVQFFYKKK